MKRAWKNLKKFLGSEEQEELMTPNNVHVIFELKYHELTIGFLELKDGKWSFRYSEEFAKQNEVLPLIDFPSTTKVYVDERLWPFFAHRIPGLGQPEVQKIIEKEHINRNSDVDLLKRFGQRTITNPFELSVI